MANEEHLYVLEQGVSAWNRWRAEHEEIKPDLSGADLYMMDLHAAYLRDADLSGANLIFADLRHAVLYHSKLSDALLVSARLNNADLRGGDHSGADFSHADLRGAVFKCALLTGADFSHALLHRVGFVSVSLRGANFSGAETFFTVFVDADLRDAEGLDKVQYSAPSEISTGTIYRSGGELPEVFLRGCGLKDWEIEAAKLHRADLSREQVVELTYKVIELRSDPLLQFNSCFISYSGRDEGFAKRLHRDLQGTGVRCWFAPEDMKIGDRIRNRIDDSIRLHDKLLLVLSAASVGSQWIEQEVETALEKEREQGYNVLSPVRLDDAVMSARSGWPALVKKTRHIGDFRRWSDPAEYRKAFERQLDDLRAEAGDKA
jgi:uncharacterized protein YjbI with pentapeptide repeats